MLGELVREFGGRCERLGDAGHGGPDVRGVAVDSRAVRSGDLYAALVGTREDGARYAPDAVARGAAAVLAARAAGLERLAVPLWVHGDARALVGRVAARLAGDPARGLLVIAITGTNGKTTTAHLAAELLERCGRRPGLLGTVGGRLADGTPVDATHTTPDAPALWRFVARLRESGGDALVLEASSHALAQERLSGLTPTVAVFTNLTRDHLDYHGTMEAYAEAKARLFDALEPGGFAVINADDPRAELFAARAEARGARVVRYGIRPAALDARSGGVTGTGSRVDLCADSASSDLEGTDLTLSGMGFYGVRVRLPLLGRHNVENALAALAAVRLAGAGPSALAEGLATVVPPPGRLEPVEAGARGVRVLVDYAHTEDALANVLGVLRAALGATPGRLIVVFGCGGDRDRGKRAPMGRVASELADLAVVTSDNPRGEDPRAICDEVLAGARGPRARAEVLLEPDRRLAIRLALRRARPGDVVLLAGKGHEVTQTVAGETSPFDDRAVAREELA